MDTGIKCLERQCVLEVDISDERDRRMRNDLGQGSSGPPIRDSDANNLTPGVCKLVDLPQGGGRVPRVGSRHRLDDDGIVSANLDITDVKDACLSAWRKQHRVLS
jgi:hypothetical protein